MSSTADPTTSAELPKSIRIGTRRSILAKVQTYIIRDQLQAAHPSLEIIIVEKETQGDKNHDQPLHGIGDKGLWTSDLEAMLLKDQLDMIVHSLKDMPTTLPDAFVIGAINVREDPRDAFVAKAGSPYKTLAELPEGSVIGTSSVRRMAQIRRQYPHLVLKDVRGNIHLRLKKLDTPEPDAIQYDGLILAASGLLRMDWGNRCTQMLEHPEMLWGVGQGSLGVEIRKGDAAVAALVKGCTHPKSAMECLAERAVMRTLEGGCSVPIGVQTKWLEGDKLQFRARVVSVDGKKTVETVMENDVADEDAAEAFGKAVAADLRDKGAQAILDEINVHRQ